MKTIFKLTVLLSISILAYLSYSKSSYRKFQDLTSQIEALANSEGGNNKGCYGDGSISCSDRDYEWKVVGR